MQQDSKSRLLDSAQQVFRSKGYSAATVDDICETAGVTKGSFFHHFKSKEELTVEAAAHWSEWTETVFAGAPYRQHSDPRERVLAYIDFRAGLVNREIPEYTCLLGTLVQETYATHPAIRAACEQALNLHVASLTPDIEAAKTRYAARATWSAESVAYFIQTVLQGSFIFAKATGGSTIVRQNLGHLRRYVEMLLPVPQKRTRKPKA
jgi:TetR/AcrR family transcriptional repressor of nem operon